jgi:hypothetical protein
VETSTNKRVEPLTEEEELLLTLAIQQYHSRASALVNAGVDASHEWQIMQNLEMIRRRLTLRPEGE